MMVRISALLVLLLLALARPAFAHSVPAAVTDALGRGINLESWFQSASGRPVTPAEMHEIARLGFTHVRIPLNPDLLQTDPSATLQRLNTAISQLNDAGLLVVVDMHVGSKLNAAIARKDPAGMPALCSLWTTLGRGLASTSPTKVALELYNEPQMWDVRWAYAIPKLIGCVRAVAPRHTVLIGGTWMNNWTALKRLPTIADPNVVYVFHYYEPMSFTHQGAFWLAGSTEAAVADVPFPPRMTEAVSGTIGRLEAAGNAASAKKLQAYVMGDDGVAKINRDFDQIAAWRAERGNPPLVMTEFGVIAKAPAADRAAWMDAVRSAAEARGIGWTMWDYGSSFGLYTNRKKGLRLLDTGVARALGLSVDTPPQP